MNPARRLSRFGAGSAWTPIEGGITSAQGYLACGVTAGLKKGGPDLALIFSSLPANGSAVFTLNQVLAAPVIVSRRHLRRSRGKVRAIILNSGCANACTGEKGIRDAIQSAQRLALRLQVNPYHVLVASTGVIGQPLHMRRLLKGISLAVPVLSAKGGEDAARAIMTTDTRAKTYAVQGNIAGKAVRIGGMAKGSGMIHPQMATMLSVITTDAGLPRTLMDSIFRRVVDRTFNCLTVDGDTSTNDMVLLMANGASEAEVDSRSASYFEEGLERVCEALAKSIARDGEGATKFVEVTVQRAPSFADARRVAKAIAHSPLVKAALYGEELNWGRILCAAGYSGIPFNPDKVTLKVCGIPVFRNGTGISATRMRAEQALKSRDIQILLDLQKGNSAARVWTCDLTRGYIDINASYIT